MFTHKSIDIKRDEEVTFLRAYLYPTLSLDMHVDKLAGKLGKGIFAIRCLINIMPKKGIITAYCVHTFYVSVFVGSAWMWSFTTC